jgi:hypothetical protein
VLVYGGSVVEREKARGAEPDLEGVCWLDAIECVKNLLELAGELETCFG